MKKRLVKQALRKFLRHEPLREIDRKALRYLDRRYKKGLRDMARSLNHYGSVANDTAAAIDQFTASVAWADWANDLNDVDLQEDSE